MRVKLAPKELKLPFSSKPFCAAAAERTVPRVTTGVALGPPIAAVPSQT